MADEKNVSLEGGEDADEHDILAALFAENWARHLRSRLEEGRTIYHTVRRPSPSMRTCEGETENES